METTTPWSQSKVPVRAMLSIEAIQLFRVAIQAITKFADAVVATALGSRMKSLPQPRS